MVDMDSKAGELQEVARHMCLLMDFTVDVAAQGLLSCVELTLS